MIKNWMEKEKLSTADGRATLGVSVDVFVRKVTVKVERAKCRSVRDVYMHRNDLVLATPPSSCVGVSSTCTQRHACA